MTEITKARSIISFSIDSILNNSSENLNSNDLNKDTKGDENKVTDNVADDIEATKLIENEDSGGKYLFEKLEEYKDILSKINENYMKILSNSVLPSSVIYKSICKIFYLYKIDYSSINLNYFQMSLLMIISKLKTKLITIEL